MTTLRRIAILTLIAASAASCDKKEAGASTESTGSKAAPAAAAAGGSKCKEAAEHKAKLKDPNVDPNTLGSVEFDKQDCEGGKWSAGKADCILAAKDYATAERCE
jgi:hypothetical protein